MTTAIALIIQLGIMLECPKSPGNKCNFIEKEDGTNHNP